MTSYELEDAATSRIFDMSRADVERVLERRRTPRLAYADKMLFKLFSDYPHNVDMEAVRAKVKLLNMTYNAGVPMILEDPMAETIVARGEEIDALIESGNLGVVKTIATLMSDGAAKGGHDSCDRTFYSFASKYCSFHKRDVYPRFDSHVKRALWRLAKDGFIESEKEKSSLQKLGMVGNYDAFEKLERSFMERMRGAGIYKFKDLAHADDFLWMNAMLALGHYKG